MLTQTLFHVQGSPCWSAWWLISLCTGRWTARSTIDSSPNCCATTGSVQRSVKGAHTESAGFWFCFSWSGPIRPFWRSPTSSSMITSCSIVLMKCCAAPTVTGNTSRSRSDFFFYCGTLISYCHCKFKTNLTDSWKKTSSFKVRNWVLIKYYFDSIFIRLNYLN